MANVAEAKLAYREACDQTAHARMWEGANNARMGGVLAAEASAASSYIQALEEAENIRAAEAAHPHRKPGKAQ